MQPDLVAAGDDRAGDPAEQALVGLGRTVRRMRVAADQEVGRPSAVAALDLAHLLERPHRVAAPHAVVRQTCEPGGLGTDVRGPALAHRLLEAPRRRPHRGAAVPVPRLVDVVREDDAEAGPALGAVDLLEPAEQRVDGGRLGVGRREGGGEPAVAVAGGSRPFLPPGQVPEGDGHQVVAELWLTAVQERPGGLVAGKRRRRVRHVDRRGAGRKQRVDRPPRLASDLRRRVDGDRHARPPERSAPYTWCTAGIGSRSDSTGS